MAQARSELFDEKKLSPWMESFFAQAEQSELRTEVELARIEVALQSPSLSTDMKVGLQSDLSLLLNAHLSEGQRKRVVQLQQK